jgi:hypothetical protein
VPPLLSVQYECFVPVVANNENLNSIVPDSIVIGRGTCELCEAEPVTPVEVIDHTPIPNKKHVVVRRAAEILKVRSCIEDLLPDSRLTLE